MMTDMPERWIFPFKPMPSKGGVGKGNRLEQIPTGDEPKRSRKKKRRRIKF
jgi:hypothetical protein